MEENRYPSKPALWGGWVLTILIGGAFVFSAVMKLMQPPMVVEEFGRLQLPGKLILGIGILELACTVIYLIPRTAILGAILLTGYLGGAILTHLRIDDPFISPAIMGVILWAAIFLREPRLRDLIPVRRCRSCAVPEPSSAKTEESAVTR